MKTAGSFTTIYPKDETSSCEQDRVTLKENSFKSPPSKCSLDFNTPTSFNIMSSSKKFNNYGTIISQVGSLSDDLMVALKACKNLKVENLRFKKYSSKLEENLIKIKQENLDIALKLDKNTNNTQKIRKETNSMIMKWKTDIEKKTNEFLQHEEENALRLSELKRINKMTVTQLNQEKEDVKNILLNKLNQLEQEMDSRNYRIKQLDQIVADKQLEEGSKFKHSEAMFFAATNAVMTRLEELEVSKLNKHNQNFKDDTCLQKQRLKQMQNENSHLKECILDAKDCSLKEIRNLKTELNAVENEKHNLEAANESLIAETKSLRILLDSCSKERKHLEIEKFEMQTRFTLKSDEIIALGRSEKKLLLNVQELNNSLEQMHIESALLKAEHDKRLSKMLCCHEDQIGKLNLKHDEMGQRKKQEQDHKFDSIQQTVNRLRQSNSELQENNLLLSNKLEGIFEELCQIKFANSIAKNNASCDKKKIDKHEKIIKCHRHRTKELKMHFNSFYNRYVLLVHENEELKRSVESNVKKLAKHERDNIDSSNRKTMIISVEEKAKQFLCKKKSILGKVKHLKKDKQKLIKIAKALQQEVLMQKLYISNVSNNE